MLGNYSILKTNIAGFDIVNWIVLVLYSSAGCSAAATNRYISITYSLYHARQTIFPLA